MLTLYCFSKFSPQCIVLLLFEPCQSLLIRPLALTPTLLSFPPLLSSRRQRGHSSNDEATLRQWAKEVNIPSTIVGHGHPAIDVSTYLSSKYVKKGDDLG